MKATYLSDEIKQRLERIRTDDRPTDVGRFPDVLVTGPQRTASTWLYYNLKRHPQVFLPRQQEVFYFSTLGRADHDKFRYPLLEDYLRIMSESGWTRAKKRARMLVTLGELYTGAVIAEVTPSYAALEPEVIAEILAIKPGMRAIMMLRHPVERAISHATKDLVRRTNREAASIPIEDWRRFFTNRGQIKLARYGTMIGNWTAHLQKGRLFLGDFRQIRESPERLLGAIHQFLGIRDGHKYCRGYSRQRINANPVVELPEGLEDYLRTLLAEEVREYESLVGEVRAGHAIR